MSFVPLAPDPPPSGAAGAQKDTAVRMKLLAANPAGAPVAAQPAASVSPPSQHASHHCPQTPPKINLTRVGDRISRIHIECSCGQVLELDCLYDPAETE